MTKGLVSVIIPVYGDGEYIQRAVDSALNQTYQLVEVVVVDDNGVGTENQKEVAERMLKYADYSNVKYVCHEVNKNGSAARNTGVKNSDGEYIALLDDDDVFNPEKLERQVAALKDFGEEYALSYCSIEIYVDNKKKYEGHAVHDGYLLREVLLSKVEISTPTLVIRRSAYEHIGGFDESFRRHQDWEFIARMADEFKFKAVDYVGFKRNLTQRNSARDPETAKKYREHYLEKMMPYIEKLDKKTQKDIIINHRLVVAFIFYKYKGLGAFWKEYRAIKPGIRGVKFICKKFAASVARMVKGEKLRRKI